MAIATTSIKSIIAESIPFPRWDSEHHWYPEQAKLYNWGNETHPAPTCLTGIFFEFVLLGSDLCIVLVLFDLFLTMVVIVV